VRNRYHPRLVNSKHLQFVLESFKRSRSVEGVRNFGSGDDSVLHSTEQFDNIVTTFGRARELEGYLSSECDFGLVKPASRGFLVALEIRFRGLDDFGEPVDTTGFFRGERAPLALPVVVCAALDIGKGQQVVDGDVKVVCQIPHRLGGKSLVDVLSDLKVVVNLQMQDAYT
jgi:hypothetical protein